MGTCTASMTGPVRPCHVFHDTHLSGADQDCSIVLDKVRQERCHRALLCCRYALVRELSDGTCRPCTTSEVAALTVEDAPTRSPSVNPSRTLRTPARPAPSPLGRPALAATSAFEGKEGNDPVDGPGGPSKNGAGARSRPKPYLPDQAAVAVGACSDKENAARSGSAAAGEFHGLTRHGICLEWARRKVVATVLCEDFSASLRLSAEIPVSCAAPSWPECQLPCHMCRKEESREEDAECSQSRHRTRGRSAAVRQRGHSHNQQSGM